MGNAGDLDPDLAEIEQSLITVPAGTSFRFVESDLARIARDLGRVVVAWDANDRAAGIGGSEIWRVVHDPMACYCEKRGITAPFEDTDATEAGRFLEPGIAAWFAARTGYRLRGDGRLVVRHPSEPWIFASPDRFVYSADGALLGGLEIKNVSEWRKDGWGSADDYDLPEPYYYQIQWCLGVTGLRRWWVAPLVGGNKIRTDHIIEADPAFFSDLVTIARAFWQRVQAGEPPAITGSDSSREYLKARYRKATDDLVAAPAEAASLAAIYVDASEKAKAAETIKDEAQNKLCAMTGNAAGIAIDGFSVTWKPNKYGVRAFRCARRGS